MEKFVNLEVLAVSENILIRKIPQEAFPVRFSEKLALENINFRV